jgi:hypothetical protein
MVQSMDNRFIFLYYYIVSILGTEEAKLNEYRISSFERGAIFTYVCKCVIVHAILSRKAR